MSEQEKRGPRGYRMVRRRETLQAMRRRITEAAFELHGSVGPANTTIKAVAERAGVQRHTVYNHFPDMASLFRACTDHGMLSTGMPNAGGWLAIADPADRLQYGLDDMYAYYRANSGVLRNVLRDMEMMATVGGVEPMLERMAELFSTLAAGWPGDASAQHLRGVAIAHAMAFDTWRSFAERGVPDPQLRDLMVRMVATIDPAYQPADITGR